MGFEEILYGIIILFVLTNISVMVLLNNKVNELKFVKTKLQPIINKNEKITIGYQKISTSDLTEILFDKVNYFESENRVLYSKLAKSKTVNKNLKSLNDVITNHVNTLNKDLDKFITCLLKDNDDALNVKDLQTLTSKFKAALSKANHLQEGLFVRTELLQGYIEKMKIDKSEKTKNLSNLVVKSGSLNNRLCGIDKIVYSQNSELLDIVGEITKIYKKLETENEKVFSKIKERINDNARTRISKINNRTSDSKVHRSIKDIMLIKKEIKLIKNNRQSDIVVKSINEKLETIEKQLNQSLIDDSKTIDELTRLNSENVKQIVELCNSANNLENNKNKEIDHFDIKRIVAKSIDKNEYLLQQIGDLIRESEYVSDLSNLEWERSKSETLVNNEMKKNISVMMILLESIKVVEKPTEEFELDLSQFRVNEDGEILI